VSGRPLSRRRFLGLLGGIGLASASGVELSRVVAARQPGRLLRSQLSLPRPFAVPLPIPPVLPARSDVTTDYYEISQRVARQEILPGVSTEIWGYDGRFPGPTISARSGRRTVVQHRNELPVASVVHLHGGRTPAAGDGYPTDLILPAGADRGLPRDVRQMDPRAVLTRGQRSYAYPLEQRAATLWYHDHRMDFNGPSVWRGLAGFFLIHDREEAALPLPDGDRDVPLMITDRAFAADGSLRYPSLDPTLMATPGVERAYSEGVLGDVVLVNGAPWPVLEVEAVRYRFRVLNASNARRYRLTLAGEDGRALGFVQIGSDGGLLARPLVHQQIDIAPAERFDVVIDFSGCRVGERVTLTNRLGSGTTKPIMQFRVARRGRDDSHVPPKLSDLERLDARQAATTRDFLFRSAEEGGWLINNQPFDPRRIDASPPLGDVESWRFTSDFHHPIHLHLVHFQILARDTGDPGPYDAGWKDVLDLRPSEQATVIARFGPYRGRYVVHCHYLEHVDMAMMANFEVL
jgi:spore coat protein A